MTSKASQIQAREARLAGFLLDVLQIMQGVTKAAIDRNIAGPTEPDEYPSNSDLRRAESIVTLYCSPKLRLIYSDWSWAAVILEKGEWSDDPSQGNIQAQAALFRVLKAQKNFEDLARAEIEGL